MTFYVDGTTGLTFNNGTTQNSAGQVLQVVNASSTSVVTITTNTYTDTGLSATITPKFATSKILVLVNQELYGSKGAGYQGFGLKIIRNSTDVYTPISDSNGPYDVWSSAGSGVVELATKHTVNYVDSPATTSATTYKTQARPYQAGTLYVQGTATMILMEIAA